MRLTMICLMCFTLMAQDSTAEHIKDFVQWRNANLGLRSQEEQFRQYRENLIASNMSAKDADAIILDLKQNADRVGAARWDASLLDPAYPMSREPNRLLTDVVKGKRPGSALDIGTGQGRNSLYLAKLGWSVTGFDQAEKALSEVRQRAADAKLSLQAVLASFDRFDYGSERWDLVVDMYEFVPVRKFSNGLTVYLSGDTGPMSDMNTIVRAHYRPDLAIVNIGDVFTSGPEEAAFEMNTLLRPKAVLPSHVNEIATSGGRLIPGTKTAKFLSLIEMTGYVPLSGRTMGFNEQGRCVSGCN